MGLFSGHEVDPAEIHQKYGHALIAGEAPSNPPYATHVEGYRPMDDGATAHILPGTGRGTGVAGGGGLPREVRPEVAIARRLRREMPPSEARLWQKLRSGRAGPKFRRQHPVGPYVVDFYCREAGPIIEIDGEVHDRADRPQRDETRLRFLREQGYRVVRIAARRVMADADAVADAIATLVATPLHQPAAGPPPRAGEDIAPCQTRSPSPAMPGEDLKE